MNALLVDCAAVDPEAVRQDATLEQLGLDSLDVVELQMQVEEEFGIELADDAFTLESTVQQYYDAAPDCE